MVCDDKKEIKTIAMYLPQFHRVPENDEWWGEGFTDWVTVKNARPLNEEHLQPRLPLDGNYYDLLEKETMEHQAELAAEYGIDGFCFYHYYFGEDEGGRKKLLLEKPAENLLGWTDVPMRFCFCWANETWARSWSAVSDANPWAEDYEPEAEKEEKETGRSILMEQEYGGKKSWEEHFGYLLPFFRDERYIKVDGKPVFLIYKPEIIGCLDEMADCWRGLAEAEGLPGLYIIGLNMTGADHHLDAALIPGPGGYLQYDRMRMPAEGGLWEDASRVWEKGLGKGPIGDMKTYYGAFAGYDDSPRRGKNGIIISGNDPGVFERYLPKMMRKNLMAGSDIQFINAWNEWGEGNMLEPDELFGYGFLEAVRRTVSGEEHLTEKQYMLRRFGDALGELKGRGAWLYGTGKNAEAIAERYDGAFGFSGYIDRAKENEVETVSVMGGKPVISPDEVPDGSTVIIAAGISSAFEIYEREAELFKSKDIKLFDMYGNDVFRLMDSVRGAKTVSGAAWQSMIENYDVISFDLMDTLLQRDVFDKGAVYVPPLMKRLFGAAARSGKEIVFTCGEEADAALQKAALYEAGAEGCDIYDEADLRMNKLNGLFRLMALRNEGRRILHIGNDLIADLIAPRMYGIDTFGYGEGFAPAGTEGGPLILPRDAEKVMDEVSRHDVISFDIFGTLIRRIAPSPEQVFSLVEKQAERRGIFSGGFAALRTEAQQRLDEPSLEDIYDEMMSIAGLDESTRDDLLALEIETEEKLVIPRKQVCRILAGAKEMGKKVIAVSDMYLPAAVLERLLSSAGIAIPKEDIFVSCEYGMRKQAGLIAEVKRKARDDIDAESGAGLLHIGDSFEHDCAPAREAGADFLLIPDGPDICSGSGEDDMEEAAMAAAMFAVWLTEDPDARGTDALLFASRDGYILKEVYDFAASFDPGLPKSIYLHISREAAANIRDDEKCRENFTAYVRSLGLCEGMTYGYIDLYAAGSAQRIMEGVCPFSLTGFYFGINEENPSGNIDVRCMPWADKDALANGYLALEKLFTSPEPQTGSYDEDGPVFAAEERTAGELAADEENIKNMIDMACSFVRRYCILKT